MNIHFNFHQIHIIISVYIVDLSNLYFRMLSIRLFLCQLVFNFICLPVRLSASLSLSPVCLFVCWCFSPIWLQVQISNIELVFVTAETEIKF